MVLTKKLLPLPSKTWITFLKHSNYINNNNNIYDYYNKYLNIISIPDRIYSDIYILIELG